MVYETIKRPTISSLCEYNPISEIYEILTIYEKYIMVYPDAFIMDIGNIRKIREFNCRYNNNMSSDKMHICTIFFTDSTATFEINETDDIVDHINEIYAQNKRLI
jgi:hypothetical protein